MCMRVCRNKICWCETDSMCPWKVRDRMLSKPLAKIHINTHTHTVKGIFPTHSHIIWKWDIRCCCCCMGREMSAWSMAPKFKQILSQYGTFIILIHTHTHHLRRQRCCWCCYLWIYPYECMNETQSNVFQHV